MSLAVAGTLADGQTEIEGSGATEVSYTHFFTELGRLTA